MIESPLLTRDEAAAYLKVSDRFVRRLQEERRIPVVKVGRWVRFRQADLDEFIAAGVVEPLAVDHGRRHAERRNSAGRSLAVVPPLNSERRADLTSPAS